MAARRWTGSVVEHAFHGKLVAIVTPGVAPRPNDIVDIVHGKPGSRLTARVAAIHYCRAVEEGRRYLVSVRYT